MVGSDEFPEKNPHSTYYVSIRMYSVFVQILLWNRLTKKPDWVGLTDANFN